MGDLRSKGGGEKMGERIYFIGTHQQVHANGDEGAKKNGYDDSDRTFREELTTKGTSHKGTTTRVMYRQEEVVAPLRMHSGEVTKGRREVVKRELGGGFKEETSRRMLSSSRISRDMVSSFVPTTLYCLIVLLWL
jgi:hypothetical protein